MAGSLAHIIAEDGTFSMKGIENFRDARGVLEECFHIIWLLSEGDEKRVSNACLRLGFPDPWDPKETKQAPMQASPEIVKHVRPGDEPEKTQEPEVGTHSIAFFPDKIAAVLQTLARLDMPHLTHGGDIVVLQKAWAEACVHLEEFRGVAENIKARHQDGSERVQGGSYSPKDWRKYGNPGDEKPDS